MVENPQNITITYPSGLVSTVRFSTVYYRGHEIHVKHVSHKSLNGWGFHSKQVHIWRHPSAYHEEDLYSTFRTICTKRGI